MTISPSREREKSANHNGNINQESARASALSVAVSVGDCAKRGACNTARGGEKINCISCGGPARVRFNECCYCRPCLQAHLLEKMFVNLTSLDRPK